MENTKNDKKMTKNTTQLNLQEVNKMASIKEEAQDYTPKQTKNIADLEKVSVEIQVEPDLRSGTDDNGKTFYYKVIIVEEEEYRVPDSVLKALKSILEEKPDLEFFKVKKTGTGLKTNYTVISLD